MFQEGINSASAAIDNKGMEMYVKQKMCKIYPQYPVQGSVFDYYIDYKTKRLRMWHEQLTAYEYQTDWYR